MTKKPKRGNIYLRGQVWWLRYMVNGQTTSQSLATTDKREAQQKANELLMPLTLKSKADALAVLQTRIEDTEQAIVDAMPKIPLTKAWDAYLQAANRPDSGPRTLLQYESEANRFVSWMEREFPEIITMEQVTREHAEAYAQDMRAARLSASTFNQHRNFLSLLWRTLKDTATLKGNPWADIALLRKKPLESRKQALTPKQFDELLVAAESDADMHDLFIVLALTGLRRVDAVKIKWGEVDFSRGCISVAPQKTRRTGKLVHIPLFPQVKAMLDNRQAGKPLDPAAYVFPALVDAYDKDNGATLNKRIMVFFLKAGIQPSEKRANRARAASVFGAHSFRHFAATTFAAAGMPAAMIKTITGHGTDAMLDHYLHLGSGLAGEISKRISAAPIKALPPMLPDAHNATLLEINKLAKKMNAKNWQTTRAKMLEMLQ